jgi:hypothetical protein
VALGGRGMPRLAGFEQVSRWLDGDGPDVFGGFKREPDEATAYATDDGQPADKSEFTGPALEALERIKAGPSIHELFKKLVPTELLDDSDDRRYMFAGTRPVGTGQTNDGGDYFAGSWGAKDGADIPLLADEAAGRVHVVPARPPALTFASPEDEARWKDAVEKSSRLLEDACAGFGPSPLTRALPDLLMLEGLKR